MDFLSCINTRPSNYVIIITLCSVQFVNAVNVICSRYAITHGMAPSVFVALRVAICIPLLEIVNILMRPSAKILSSDSEISLATDTSRSESIVEDPGSPLLSSSSSSLPIVLPTSSTTPLISSASFSLEVRQPTWRDTVYMIVLSLVGITGNFLMWINGLRLTSATTTGITSAVSPVAVAVIAIICKKEQPTFLKILGILVACGGTMVTLDPRNINVDMGIILLLSASTLWAAFLVFQKPLLEIFSPAYFTARAFLYGGPGIFIAACFEWENIEKLNEAPYLSWLSVIWSAVANTVIGYILTGYAIRHSSAVLAGVFINFQPGLVAILAVLLLSESFSVLQGIGTALIVLGVVIVTIGRYREDRLEKEKEGLEAVKLRKLDVK